MPYLPVNDQRVEINFVGFMKTIYFATRIDNLDKITQTGIVEKASSRDYFVKGLIEANALAYEVRRRLA